MSVKRVNLVPFSDHVIVEAENPEAITPGGIVLPDVAQKKSQRGVVVAIGPGKLLDNGQRAEMSVSVGDRVIYERYVGSDIEIDKREITILRESDLFARIL